MGGFGVSYVYNDKINLWAAPTFKYKLNSITSDVKPIEQRFLNVGLQTGIRINLHKMKDVLIFCKSIYLKLFKAIERSNF